MLLSCLSASQEKWYKVGTKPSFDGDRSFIFLPLVLMASDVGKGKPC